MNEDSLHAHGAQGGLRARVRKLTHDAILDAAEQVLGERGLEASMESISARAGVAVGTLYNHFDSREALFEALEQDRRERLLAAVREAVVGSAALPFRERLTAVLRAIATATQAQSAYRKIAFELDLPRIRSRQETMAKALIACFREVFVQGQEEGVLAPDPHQLQPTFLLGLLQVSFAVNRLTPERLPLETLPEVVLRQLLDGARASGRPATGSRAAGGR